MRREHVDEWYTAYLEGELPAEQRRQVDEHLRACPRCAEGLQAVRQLAEELRAMPAQPLPADFTATLRARIPARRSFGWRLPALASGLVAIIALLILVPYCFQPAQIDHFTRPPQFASRGNSEKAVAPAPAVSAMKARTPVVGNATAPSETYAVPRAIPSMTGKQRAPVRIAALPKGLVTQMPAAASPPPATMASPVTEPGDAVRAVPPAMDAVTEKALPMSASAPPMYMDKSAAPAPVPDREYTTKSADAPRDAYAAAVPENAAGGAPAENKVEPVTRAMAPAYRVVVKAGAPAGVVGLPQVVGASLPGRSPGAVRLQFAERAPDRLTIETVNPPADTTPATKAASLGGRDVAQSDSLTHAVDRSVAGALENGGNEQPHTFAVTAPAVRGGLTLKLTAWTGEHAETLYLFAPGPGPRAEKSRVHLDHQSPAPALARLADDAGIYLLCPSTLAERPISATLDNQTPLDALKTLASSLGWKVNAASQAWVLAPK